MSETVKYFTPKQLLGAAASGIKEADVELLGGWVKVRGLTGGEDAKVETGSVELDRRGNMKFRADARQRLTLRHGLVEPRLQDGEINQFIETVGATDLKKITAKIAELSGTSPTEMEDAEEAFPGSN